MNIGNYKLKILFILLFVGCFTMTGEAEAAVRTWDGGGVDGTCGGGGTANNWTCAANWSADTAPTSADTVVFDATSTKNATINANLSGGTAPLGISINTGYTGTITQATSITIAVGSSGFAQAAGTFTGGNSDITINGTFTLSGGAFTSTSGILQVGRSASSETVFTVSSGTFNHNNGTVTFASTDNGNNGNFFTVDVVTSLTLYNVVVNCECVSSSSGLYTASGDTIIAANNFTHTNGVLYGTWEVQGNVTIGSGADGGPGTLTYITTGAHTYAYATGGTGPHLRINHAGATITAVGGTTALKVSLFSLLAGSFTAPSGTMTVGRSANSETVFTVSSGTFNHNNGTVTFASTDYGNNGNFFTVDVATTLTLYDVVIDCACATGGGDQIKTASGDTIIAANNFTYTNGRLGGTWEVQGSYTVGAGADGGTAAVSITGSGSQTYVNSGGTGPSGTFTINKPSGTLTLSGTLPVYGNWTHTKGTVNAGSSTLSFSSGDQTFTPGSASYNNIIVGWTSNTTLTVSGTATVLGNLTITNSSQRIFNSGTLNVYGNVDVSGTYGFQGGTGIIQIGGSGAQTLSSSGGGTLGNIVINKPSGMLTLSGTIPVTGSWTWMAGQLNANTSNLKFTGTVDATLFTPGAVEYYDIEVARLNSYYFTVSGTAVIAHNLVMSQNAGSPARFDGGNLDVKGDVSLTATSNGGGSGTIRIVGVGAQTISSSNAGGGFANIIVNKPSGVLSLSGSIKIDGTWTWQAGKLDAGTSTLQIGHTSDSVIFTPGNVSYYNLEIQQTNSYDLTLGGNLTVTNNLSITGVGTARSFLTSGYDVMVKNIVMSGNYGLNLGTSKVKISGDFTRTNGTFTAGTSTIILNGTNQTISGATTFYNLYKILPASTTDTLTFTAATTYTIAAGGTARFIGTRGYPLAIQSSSAGSAFTLTKTGNVIAEYVSLKDCTVSVATSAPASTSVSGNTNWTFTKEFVSKIRATGGDYTTLSSWESALGAVDLTAAATKVFSHGGITGTIADNTAVTGATSGATGTVVHATSTQILIKSITGTFQNAEQIRVDVSNYVTSSDTGSGAIAVAETYNDWPNALNDSVAISGETTDADNFILVTSPLTNRPFGKLKDTASSYYQGFTLKPSSATAIVFDNQQNYTRVEGISVDGTNATATNFRLNGTSPIGNKLISANGVDGFSLSGGAIVANSLAYSGTGKCFEDTTGATTHYTVYNSTARACAHGFHGNNTTTAITLKNVLASGNSTADFALTNTGAKSVTYSASSDATADDWGTTTGDRVSQTFSFVDSTNKDFHLTSRDAGARGFGTDLSVDTTYPIVDDLDGEVRPTVNTADANETSYDIGADEANYQSARF